MMNRFLWQILFCFLTALSSNELGMCGDLVDQDRDELWRVVVRSHLIVAGVPKVPVEAVRASTASPSGCYIPIEVKCHDVLKGPIRDVIELQWYSKGNTSPTAARVMDMDGRKMLFFSVQSHHGSQTRYYFVSGMTSSLRLSTPEHLEQTRSELRNQRRLLDTFVARFQPRDVPLYSRVKDLIDATTRGESEVNAFSELESLGSPAVPAIVMLI